MRFSQDRIGGLGGKTQGKASNAVEKNIAREGFALMTCEGIGKPLAAWRRVKQGDFIGQRGLALTGKGRIARAEECETGV